MLKNKVVFVTGSTHGIGKEIVLLFAHEGANVVVTYFKDKKAADKVLKECKELGSPNPILVKLNVKNTGSIKDAVKEVVSKFKQIDILVNNAGVISWEQLKDQKYEDIEDQVRTNLEGMIKVTRASLPYLKEAVVNIASGAGKTAYEGLTTYSATKFGVRGFTQALAQEMEQLKVYAVNPGMTATRMTNFRGAPPARVAAIVVNTVVGKYDIESGGDIDVWDYEE